MHIYRDSRILLHNPVALFPYRCVEGYYSSVTDGVECTQCPVGHECPDPTNHPIMCLEGTYALDGQTSCSQCPVGFSCLSADVLPTACPEGWYSAEGEIACTPCPPGHYCPVTPPSPSPIQCSDGFYAHMNGSTLCERCPSGHECSNPAILPQLCPPGFFSSSEASTSCTMVCTCCIVT